MPRHRHSAGGIFHHRRSFRRFMHLTFCWRFALPYTFRVKDTFLCPRISERDFISNSGISIALKISTKCLFLLGRKKKSNEGYIIFVFPIIIAQTYVRLSFEHYVPVDSNGEI